MTRPRAGGAFAFIAACALLCALAFAPRLSLAGPEPRASNDHAPLVVGLTGKYPPFNYVDDRGELVGFDVDIAHEICREMRRRCEFRILQWDGIIGALLAERIDVIIGSMAITPERANAVHFSPPYYESGAVLFRRPGASGPADAGFRVGVTLGTTYEAHVRAKFPQADVRTYKGDPEALTDLAAGRLDAIVTDALVGRYLQKRSGITLEQTGPPLYVERMAIPVKPSRQELAREVDAAVGRVRATKAYDEAYARYFGEGTVEQVAASGWLSGQTLGLLFRGLASTLGVCAVGLGLGALLSLLLALALVGPRPVALAVAAFVDFIRATPFIVQMLAIYFGLPEIGIRLGAWGSATLAIAIHSAAYGAEVLKTAYRSVPEGQHWASRALGLSPTETLRHVIVPQMMPVCTVPLINTVVAMIKDSAIVSVIGVHELTLQTQQIISTTFKPLALYALAACLYFVVTYPLLLAGRGLERRFKRQGLLS